MRARGAKTTEGVNAIPETPCRKVRENERLRAQARAERSREGGRMSVPRPADGKDGNDQGAVGGDEGRIEGETNPGLDKEVGKLDVINESNEGERR